MLHNCMVCLKTNNDVWLKYSPRKMTQILPCDLDLTGLLMVQLVISALDAGQGKANTGAMHGARGIRSEIMSYLELLETLSAFICSKSR